MPEAKISYQKLDHQGQIGFRVESPSLERLYIECALALTDSRVKLETVKDTDRHTVDLKAEDGRQLLAAWLNAILGLFEAERFLPRRIYFEGFDGKRIRATLRGEKHDPVRHGHVPPAAAVTLAGVDMGQASGQQGGFYARVLINFKR